MTAAVTDKLPENGIKDGGSFAQIFKVPALTSGLCIRQMTAVGISYKSYCAFLTMMKSYSQLKGELIDIFKMFEGNDQMTYVYLYQLHLWSCSC